MLIIVQGLVYLKASNDIASLDFLKFVRIFFCFVRYGSVKILTSHFPRGAPLQIRLAVS